MDLGWRIQIALAIAIRRLTRRPLLCVRAVGVEETVPAVALVGGILLVTVRVLHHDTIRLATVFKAARSKAVAVDASQSCDLGTIE